jgi:hypothetical protein
LLLGRVETPDAETTITIAIERFEITERQRRLAATTRSAAVNVRD